MSAFRTGITLKLGAIFTLVTDLHSATELEEHMSTLCQGHDDDRHDPAAVKARTACPVCDNDDRALFVKGRKVGKSVVVVTKEEIEAARAEAVGVTNKVVELAVHPSKEVTSATVQGRKGAYFLTPANSAAEAPYAAIVDVLKRHPELTMVGLYSPLARPGLYMVVPHGDTLMLVPRCRPDEVKVTLRPPVEVAATDAELMDTILALTVRPFEAVRYTDTYQGKLAELVAGRQGVELVAGAAPTAPLAAVTDLSTLLRAALAEVTAA